jgi:ubiquitin C-terminal hydrolase
VCAYRFKPQFAGNEQQDSQEFLNEMLDAIHEDVNRVIHKPYVQVGASALCSPIGLMSMLVL